MSTLDLDKIRKDAEQRMQKSLSALKDEFNKMRTGRAHPSLLEHITISYYGTDTPLSQVGTVSVGDAHTLTVSAWDRQIIPTIEKAIREADLGLNPVTNGDIIRVPLPTLTEDRRKELVKFAKTKAEEARVAIRNIRRDANNDSKKLLKDKEITEDEERGCQDFIQKLTDKYIIDVDKILKEKETDLMEI